MNVLFLSTESPLPPDHGHHIRTFNVLKHLASYHKIHFVGFAKSQQEADEHTSKLKELCTSVYLCVPPYCQSRRKLLYTIIKSILWGYPFTAYRYFSKNAAQKILEIIQTKKIQLIHVDMLHLGIYKNFLKCEITVLTNHNVEFLRLKRWYEVERNLAKKIFLLFQFIFMRKLEKAVCSSFRKCIAVSEHDKSVLRNLCWKDNFTVVANGVDLAYFRPRDEKQNHSALVWTGEMSDAYNSDAVIYFITEIWGLLKKQISDIDVLFVGANPPHLLKEYSEKDEHIVLLGYVDDVRKYMTRNNIFIAPIRIGSGTKIKVLNAMAMGMPVVTTTVGAEGIDVRQNENVIIADTPTDFASGILNLVLNPRKAYMIGAAGRNLVEQKYDWESILKNIDSLYHDVSKKSTVSQH